MSLVSQQLFNSASSSRSSGPLRPDEDAIQFTQASRAPEKVTWGLPDFASADWKHVLGLNLAFFLPCNALPVTASPISGKSLHDLWQSFAPRDSQVLEYSRYKKGDGGFGGAHFSCTLDPELSSLQTQGVVIPDLLAVRAYLLAFPRLREALPGICKQCQAHFGAGSQIALEMYTDPEIEDKYLTIYVRHPGYDSKFLEQLEELSTAAATAFEPESGYLLITTDFAKPR